MESKAGESGPSPRWLSRTYGLVSEMKAPLALTSRFEHGGQTAACAIQGVVFESRVIQ